MLSAIQQKPITTNIYHQNSQKQACGANPSFKDNEEKDPYKLIFKGAMVMFYMVAFFGCIAEIAVIGHEKGFNWFTDKFASHLLQKNPNYKIDSALKILGLGIVGGICDYFYHKKK